ncbi:hypothetical protein MK079_00445 [Candidatus Gracilibacteria bacterium]|nr:hypothetical protein [Candidatus Gracilibacteria bacterium]
MFYFIEQYKKSFSRGVVSYLEGNTSFQPDQVRDIDNDGLTIDDMIQKAKEGNLSSAELVFIANRMEEEKDKIDTSTVHDLGELRTDIKNTLISQIATQFKDKNGEFEFERSGELQFDADYNPIDTTILNSVSDVRALKKLGIKTKDIYDALLKPDSVSSSEQSSPAPSETESVSSSEQSSPAPSETESVSPQTYEVKKGNTLYAIVREEYRLTDHAQIARMVNYVVDQQPAGKMATRLGKDTSPTEFRDGIKGDNLWVGDVLVMPATVPNNLSVIKKPQVNESVEYTQTNHQSDKKPKETDTVNDNQALEVDNGHEGIDTANENDTPKESVNYGEIIKKAENGWDNQVVDTFTGKDGKEIKIRLSLSEDIDNNLEDARVVIDAGFMNGFRDGVSTWKLSKTVLGKDGTISQELLEQETENIRQNYLIAQNTRDFKKDKKKKAE